jgi:hypothetical protein
MVEKHPQKKIELGDKKRKLSEIPEENSVSLENIDRE